MPFNPLMPADILKMNLQCALYFRRVAGEIDEVGYRVFETSNEIAHYVIPVKSHTEEEAMRLMETTVYPHIRKRYGLPDPSVPRVDEVKTHEVSKTIIEPAEPTPGDSPDGDRPAARNKPGRPKGVSRPRRKQVAAGEVG